MKNFIQNDFTFQRKVESEPADISIEKKNIVSVEAKMNYAVSIAMIQIAYEAKLINDATYRNILKKSAQ